MYWIPNPWYMLRVQDKEDSGSCVCRNPGKKQRILSKVTCAYSSFTATLFMVRFPSIHSVLTQRMPCGKANCCHVSVSSRRSWECVCSCLHACLDTRARRGTARGWHRSTAPHVLKSQKWPGHVVAYPCGTRMLLCCLDVHPLAACHDNSRMVRTSRIFKN